MMAQRQCRICLERFPSLEALKTHRTSAHLPRKTSAKRICYVCRALVPSDAFNVHRASHKPPDMRHSSAWKRLRREVIDAAGGRCQACGSPESIEVHHRDWNPADNDVGNLVALCWFCHNRLHRDS
jgi:HNH endonuclease